MSMAQLKLRYAKSKIANRQGRGGIKFNPTVKYVEHSLSLLEAKSLLQDPELSFTDKFSVVEIVKVIERKIEYHYRHKDFDLAVAMAQFRLAKKLLKM